MHVWHPSFQIVNLTVQQQQRTKRLISPNIHCIVLRTEMANTIHTDISTVSDQTTTGPADLAKLAKLPPSTTRVVQSLGFSASLVAKRANCPCERNATHIIRTTGHAWHGMAAHRIRLSRP
jgi:hypothetical protein